MKISVIIPTLNEAANLPGTLAGLNTPNIEIIVADGGSQDATIALAEQAGAKVIQSPPGRATQLNHGAAKATGEIYLFLHADTQLPPNWHALIIQTLAQTNT
ncbi:glycosyltransferase, partial [filamentous cyanobacterium LEGE 11480]